MENLCERPLAGSRMTFEKACNIGHDLVHAGEVEHASFGRRHVLMNVTSSRSASIPTASHSPQDNIFSNQGYPSVWRIAS